MRSVLEKIKISLARRGGEYGAQKERLLEIVSRPGGCLSDEEALVLISYLRFHNHFKNVKSDADLIGLMQQAVYRFFEKDSYLFYQGDDPDYYYILLKGRIGIGLMTATAPAHKYFGNEMEDVFYLRTGFGFGEIAILENCKRTRSAVAVKDSHLLAFDKKTCVKLFALLGNNAERPTVTIVNRMVLFEPLSKSKRFQVSMMSQYKKYVMGSVIIAQGTASKKVGFVERGKIAVNRRITPECLSEAYRVKNACRLKKVTFPVVVQVTEIS